MREDLGLKGNELLVFAVIYGFSQGRQGCYKGSLAYLQETCGIAKQTAVDILKSLVSKGLLEKGEIYQNGVKFVTYVACPKIGQGVRKLDRGGQEIGHNSNIDNNSEIDKSISNTHKGAAFDFRKSFLELGVSEEVIDAWMDVRKTKRAVDSKVAFDRIKAEIEKSGLSANECITIAVANSWQGFSSAWVERQQPRRSAPHKETTFEHNLKVMDKMFGTNMHQQAYGKKEDIDEQ